MNIKEIITEEIVDEYRIVGPVNILTHINRGNKFKKHMDLVNTPMTQFNVRHIEGHIVGAGDMHDYYLYDKKTDNCVGIFTIQMQSRKFKNLLKPGVKAVTPHMALIPEAQRQGVSTQAYSSFLQGGPWVFVTDEHTKGASKLWDSLATGNNISFYVSDETGKPVENPMYHDIRILGPKDRFKLNN
jgi:hypothetical protein